MGKNIRGTRSLFERCDFLLGEGNSIVVVIPAHLPAADTYTLAVTSDFLKIMADYNDVAEMHYPGGEIFERIARHTQVGLVEYPPNNGEFPGEITHLAYVEVRSGL